MEFWFEMPFAAPVPQVFHDQAVDAERALLNGKDKYLRL